jgi:putative spermidine/putrescine transport system substrate-binding protein
MTPSRKRRWLASGAAALSLIAASCGSDAKEAVKTTDAAAPVTTKAAEPAPTDAPATTKAAETTTAPVDTTAPAAPAGDLEKELNVIAWAGYAEDGSTDPAYDWVTPFEDKTGCSVNVKVGGTSDEMVQLMASGEYDTVSASGDATLRLIEAGDVAPIDTARLANYATIFDYLKDQAWNSAGGKTYGVPHGWGANVLMYNTDVVKPAPDSWSVVFDPKSPYAGKVTSYDAPITIADAALYLKATKPELKITNPYALDADQLAASVELLKGQKGIVGEYWSDYLKYEEAFTNGSLVLGTSWDIIVNTLAAADGAKVARVLPKEGATAWNDNWMVASKAKNPNCAYAWIDWITSADINAQVAEYFGEAPAQTLACGKTANADHCKQYGTDDKAFYGSLAYWTTPTKECLDGRGPICTDYAEWTKAWTEIRG